MLFYFLIDDVLLLPIDVSSRVKYVESEIHKYLYGFIFMNVIQIGSIYDFLLPS